MSFETHPAAPREIADRTSSAVHSDRTRRGVPLPVGAGREPVDADVGRAVQMPISCLMTLSDVEAGRPHEQVDVSAVADRGDGVRRSSRDRVTPEPAHRSGAARAGIDLGDAAATALP